MRTVTWLALAYCLAMRLFELALSHRNAARVLARGGHLVPQSGTNWIVAVHALWFVLIIGEESLVGPQLEAGGVRLFFAGLFVAAEGTRLWCMQALGDRWNIRVVVHPGEARIRRGPYRFSSHPNYLAATLMIGALPLALGLPISALVCLPLKVLAVRWRVRVEERSLVGEPAS